jgi:esterase/lipase superfamily enzyme
MKPARLFGQTLTGRVRWHRMVGTLIVPLLLGACATTHPLMPTPTLYRMSEEPLFKDLPPDRQKPYVDLIYMTDRAPRTDPNDPEPYTADRARSMAFGTLRVDIGDGIRWSDLASESTSGSRTIPLELKLGAAQELGRFPQIIYPLVPVPGGITRDPAMLEVHERASAAFKALLARAVAESPRKEVVLFVHGYNDTFSDAAFTASEICHFLGREFVCVMFSWPAGGKRGVLMGYAVDRESGEFAAEHLKKTIRMIADTPGVERVHLLAHSRGTDILSSAMAMLNVETYITRTTLSDRLKIRNIVLAAPDIDFDVASAKIFTVPSDPELPYGNAPNPALVFPPPGFHLTVYVSPNDKALTVSQFLFGSVIRLGRIEASKLPPEKIAEAQKMGLFDVISVAEKTDMFGHSYFTSNPAVSSDVIALIRYGAKPGDALRPLVEVERPFWRIRAPTDSPQQ